jgi:hypothetical protein
MMAPKRKKIRDMTLEELLTDDEVMDRIVGKRVRKKLQKAVGKEPKKSHR